MWPHKRPVSLWSFLINLSLLFCHLLKSCLCWWRLSLCGCSTGRAVRLRKTTPSTAGSFRMINQTIIYQLIDAAMIADCQLIIFNNHNWYMSMWGWKHVLPHVHTNGKTPSHEGFFLLLAISLNSPTASMATYNWRRAAPSQYVWFFGSWCSLCSNVSFLNVRHGRRFCFNITVGHIWSRRTFLTIKHLISLHSGDFCAPLLLWKYSVYV